MDEEIERKLFERWFKERFSLPPTAELRRSADGVYQDFITRDCWAAWRARAEIA